jgi:catechol 2,3-dioxygenase-like lactoylglutathione lyase family enzyme
VEPTVCSKWEYGGMIDHVRIPVTDIAVSREFYVRLLEPLGYRVEKDLPDRVKLRNASDGDFVWIIGTADASRYEPRHIAFRAPNIESIREFHRIGVACGGTDNGAPGPRPNYDDSYYAAFVRDPDGNNVEAVVHDYCGDVQPR